MNPNQTDYSFIMQDGNKNKAQFTGPKTQKQRILLVAFVGIAIMLLLVVVLILINLFSVDNTKKLTDLAKQQTELQRIMELGVKDSGSTKIKILAQTASSTFESHKQSTLAIALNKKIEIPEKQLALGKQAKIDEQLEVAKNSNNYEEVFIEIYENQLALYANKIKELYDKENDEDLKALFSDFYKSAVLMSTNYKTTEN